MCSYHYCPHGPAASTTNSCFCSRLNCASGVVLDFIVCLINSRLSKNVECDYTKCDAFRLNVVINNVEVYLYMNENWGILINHYITPHLTHRTYMLSYCLNVKILNSEVFHLLTSVHFYSLMKCSLNCFLTLNCWMMLKIFHKMSASIMLSMRLTKLWKCSLDHILSDLAKIQIHTQFLKLTSNVLERRKQQEAHEVTHFATFFDVLVNDKWTHKEWKKEAICHLLQWSECFLFVCLTLNKMRLSWRWQHNYRFTVCQLYIIRNTAVDCILNHTDTSFYFNLVFFNAVSKSFVLCNLGAYWYSMWCYDIWLAILW